MVLPRAPRIGLLFSFALIASTIVGCSEETPTIPRIDSLPEAIAPAPLGYGAQWPNWTQGYRDAVLLSVGYESIGRSGGACKIWVQNHVRNVTDARVNVPATETNPWSDRYLWLPDPQGHVWGQCMDIRNAPLGRVVQMSWGTNSLHTFFLAGRDANGIWMLDSNWNWDGIVRFHYVTYSWWNSRTNLRYSINTIGW